jgi:hypothetical protein
MAVISITEILGGDNISGSRITINDNFKRLTNAINTIETRLDTSFNPGGSLNVGNALIRKYTNPTSSQIFTCEATGLFQGNLNVSLDLGVTQSITSGLDVTVGRNFVLSGAATGGGSFTSQVKTSFEKDISNLQLWDGIAGAPTLNPQSLTPAGSPTRQINSVIGHSVLRLDLSTYDAATSDNCDTITLPSVSGFGTTVQYGQILTIIIDVPATNAMTNFQIDGSTLAVTGTDIIMGNITLVTSNNIRKLAITLFADHNGWRVLNTAQPVAGDITY